MLLRVLNRFISYVIKVFSSLHQTIHDETKQKKLGAPKPEHRGHGMQSVLYLFTNKTQSVASFHLAAFTVRIRARAKGFKH